MRGYKSIIQEAELLLMSPEAVADFLMKRANQSTEGHFDPVDEDGESALLSRSNPLIDLALARYARFIETLRPIFQNSRSGSACRLAVLSNAARWPAYCQFPVALFGEREYFPAGRAVQTAAWLANAPREELEALFENTCNYDFISELLRRSDSWVGLSDDLLKTIVPIVGRNGLLMKHHDYLVEGLGNSGRSRALDSAWCLAESVDPSESWARLLSHLYDQLEPFTFSIKDPWALVDRWQLDPTDDELVRKESKKNNCGFLSDYQGVRKGLAKLALSRHAVQSPDLLGSDDLAMRSAAYSYSSLTPEQLLAAHQVDGDFVFEQALSNRSIWRNAAGREMLRRVEWRDDPSDGARSDRYRVQLKTIWGKLAKEHPEWFEEQEK